MSASPLLRLASLVGLIAVFAGCASAPTSATCDRDCLLSIATRYADGLTAQTLDDVPLAPVVRSTENAQPMAVDAGIFKSAEAWRYRHTFVDETTGQVGLLGVVSEGGERDAMVAIRLATRGGRIVESERLVVREKDARFFVPRAVTEARPVFDRPVAPEDRASREKLVAIANRYFDSISAGDPSVAPFHPDCNRYENGMQTTNNPPRFALSCSEGIRRLIYMTNGRERRFPIVDPTRGLVVGLVAFDMPTRNETRTIRGKTVEFTPERLLLPRTLLLFELFRIEDGRIRAIEAVMMDRPIGATLGWP